MHAHPIAQSPKAAALPSTANLRLVPSPEGPLDDELLALETVFELANILLARRVAFFRLSESALDEALETYLEAVDAMTAATETCEQAARAVALHLDGGGQ